LRSPTEDENGGISLHRIWTPFPLMGKGRDGGAPEPIKPITPTFVLPRRRLCRNHENAKYVILNEVKNLMHSIPYTTQILRLSPQDDIATQSLEGKELGRRFRQLASS
jgi:hypothetical protein